MFARRAWKSVNVLLDDTSSHVPTPGAYVSRSYVFALAKPGVAGREQLDAIRKPEPLEERRRVLRHELVLAGRRSPACAYRTSSTLSNSWTRSTPRVSLPALPASRRKHGEYAQKPRGRLGAVEHLVAIEIRDGHFGGRDEEQILVPAPRTCRPRTSAAARCRSSSRD